MTVDEAIEIIAKDMDDGNCADCKMAHICLVENNEDKDCIEYHRDYLRKLLNLK